MRRASGQVRAVQEQRFRLITDDGRGLLLTLAHDAGIDGPALARCAREGARVTVQYEGEPNLDSGVAHAVAVEGAAHDGAPSLADTVRSFVREWSLPRQLAGDDATRTAAETTHSRTLRPRLEDADRVGTSICPYCAVGCAQLVYAKGDTVIHIEGDPASPINAGTLCPKGAATFGWMVNPARLTKVKYRAPHSARWEERSLDWAMDRIAHLVKQARDETFVHALPGGTVVNHTMAIAELGGATLDNEENYLIKKLLGGGLGMVWIENQARV
jgi:formate dehydrogenase major subunit